MHMKLWGLFSAVSLLVVGGCAADVEDGDVLRLLEDAPVDDSVLGDLRGEDPEVLRAVRDDLESLGMPLAEIDDVLTGFATAAAVPARTVSLFRPAEDSRTATPLSSLYLRFSGRIDTDTIDSTTVWLVERESLRRVPATLRTTGSRIVVVTPNRPLGTQSRYHVMVDGVLDTDGDAVIPYDGRFYTAPHFQSYIVQYEEDGDVFKWVDGSFDAVSNVWSALYTSAGADGLIGTADDGHNQRSDYTYDSEGDNESARVRHVGLDGVYDTPDDEYRHAERLLKWSGIGLDYFYYSAPGPDGQHGTGDEFTTGFNRRYYDAQHRPEYYCRQDGAGVTQSCTQVLYSTGAREQFVLTAPGPDGLWRTADDIPADEWTLYALDANGLTTRSDAYLRDSAGNRTPADAYRTGYTVYTHTASGLNTESRGYDGAGPDGAWDTADDAATTRVVSTYDGDGFVITQDTFEAGPDALFETADDWRLWQREW